MALRDTWHRALVYFGLAEDHDYGPEYDDYEPETGAEDVYDSRGGREAAPVRRLPTSRRRRDEIDDMFVDDEPLSSPRTREPRPPRRDARHFPRRRAALLTADPSAAARRHRQWRL